MILLVGQYSTGKTTFIRHLLERDFPGIRIGPEPTTGKYILFSKIVFLSMANFIQFGANKDRREILRTISSVHSDCDKEAIYGRVD